MNQFEHFVATAYSLVKKEFNTINVEQSSLTLNTAKDTFGDASWNIALILAKPLQQSPRQIAQTIKQLFEHESCILSIEIAGPGFINFSFTNQFFSSLAQDCFVQHENFFKTLPVKPLHYSLEFVSANPTGPLHIGHGRGGIIGDVLAKILRFNTHKVTTEFYINDAGSQITKLGSSLKIRCLQAQGHTIVMPEDGYQGQYVYDLAQECLEHYGQDVTNNDNAFFDQYAKNKMFELLKNTLNAYGIDFDVWFSEKELRNAGAIERLIEHLTSVNMIYQKQGALWFCSSLYGDDKDRVVQKSNGDYTYFAAEIAYIDNKLERSFDKLIMILGQDHHSYIQRTQALLSAFKQDSDKLTIILYQLVTLKNEEIIVRMSKRKGTGVFLQDVIDAVGKDVARFFYLQRKADAHLDFDIASALNKNDENPVYYIQYAYVRALSITKKASVIAEFSNLSSYDCVVNSELDKQLIKKIISLKPLLACIATSYSTHLLAYYTQELAQLFHHYYRHEKVIQLQDTTKSRQRLALIEIVKNTLKICLDLLGLDTPQTM